MQRKNNNKIIILKEISDGASAGVEREDKNGRVGGGPITAYIEGIAAGLVCKLLRGRGIFDSSI